MELGEVEWENRLHISRKSNDMKRTNRNYVAASVERIGNIARLIRETLQNESANGSGVAMERAVWNVLDEWFFDEAGIWHTTWRYDLRTDCLVVREGEPEEWNVPSTHVATVDGLCRTVEHLAAKKLTTPKIIRELVRLAASLHSERERAESDAGVSELH